MRVFLLTMALLVSTIRALSAQTPQVLESLPEHLMYLDGYSGNDSKITQDQLVAQKRRWEVGQTLKLCFFGGSSSVKRLIVEVGSTWAQHANLKFDAGERGQERNCLDRSAGFNHIRIGFTDRGYWSAVGTDSEANLTPLQPSMNFDRFDRKYHTSRYPEAAVVAEADPVDKGTILHEFGHAIGLLHEHQNPSLNCKEELKWEGDNNVYQILGEKPNEWSKEKVDRNLGQVGLTDPDYVAGSPDPQSIMMYALELKLFKSSSSPCFVPQNNLISEKDKLIVAKLYPSTLPIVAETIAPARSLPGPSNSAPAIVQADYKERIISDLDSDEQSVRREARSRLAKYLQDSQPSEVSDIIKKMPISTYRYQLGVATSLARSPQLALQQGDISVLGNTLKRTPDPSLREQMNRIKGFKM